MFTEKNLHANEDAKVAISQTSRAMLCELYHSSDAIELVRRHDVCVIGLG